MERWGFVEAAHIWALPGKLPVPVIFEVGDPGMDRSTHLEVASGGYANHDGS